MTDRAEPPINTPPHGWERPNLLGYAVHWDTNMIEQSGEVFDVLRRTQAQGWVMFRMADIGVRELTDMDDETHRDALLDAISGAMIPMGQHVLDHSLLDLSVTASEPDIARLHDLHMIIWQRSFDDDAATLREPASRRAERIAKGRLRDTMHLDTAVRYVADGFITDDRRIYDAADRIREHYPNLRVLSPEAALRWLSDEIRVHRLRWQQRGYQPPLPDWPTEDERAGWVALHG